MSVDEALKQLSFYKRHGATVIKQVLLTFCTRVFVMFLPVCCIIGVVCTFSRVEVRAFPSSRSAKTGKGNLL